MVETPKGYKQTEVGLIPEDWQVFRLSDHFQIFAGGDVPKDSVSQVQSEEFPYPIYANAITNKGLYGFTNQKRSNPNSMTITARGYLGHAEYRETYFFPIVRLLVLEPNGSLSAKYSTYVINHLVSFSIESTGVPQLTAPQVGKYVIPAPPNLDEQRAIATVLSDVDALLESLERLIAKKRAIKQAAMQQLLTGQTRLPGFEVKPGYKQTEVGLIPKDWDVSTFSEVSLMKSGEGITATRIDQHSQYPCYGGNGMRGFTSRFTHDGEFALIGRQGALCGNVIGVSGKFFASEHAVVVTPREGTSISFLTYVLSEMRLNQLSEASAQPGLSVTKIMQLSIPKPSTETEQHAIAIVLSDMDAEIAALEAQRNKTQNIKQSMMQELLTGKTRLV